MSSIDVIVLTYNSARLLPECVASVRAQTVSDQVNIIVIDNDSTDDTLRVARDLGIEPIANPDNVGFAAAINQAAATGSGDYVALLNPDATFGDSKSLEAMLATIQDEQTGLVGARMVTAEGAPYPNGRRFPSTTVAARHAIMGILRPGNAASAQYFGDAAGRPDVDQVVDWVSGCCLIMRRSLWEEMGGFDTRYWMYLEDADLCWRLRQRGYATVLSGPAYVVHHGGASSSFRRNKSLWHHHRSAILFYARTRTGARRALLAPAALFLLARLGVLVAVNRGGGFTAWA
ncbi:glycosyltransferase family 2 protein [Nocardia brasiliensis]|uniref:glycosyltransferase family 2 protein n=1 Tax=Nocardia brasiliensis TaxID=37326 RepID=UPI002456E093|nr:glycosyltransferase family 2 protein [Nocardia brasiliensis]